MIESEMGGKLPPSMAPDTKIWAEDVVSPRINTNTLFVWSVIVGKYIFRLQMYSLEGAVNGTREPES